MEKTFLQALGENVQFAAVSALVILVLILFMSFNTQNLTWNMFFWLFPAMALTERLVPVLNKLSFVKRV